jgi:hypothetical protein
MGNAFHSLFSIVRLSPARRIVIFQRMLVIATTLGLTRLVEHLTGALAHEVKTHELVGKYRAQKRGNLYAVPVQPIDLKADHLLSGLRSLLIGLATGLAVDHRVTVAVTEVLKGIFPNNNVRAITGLPYVEQVAAMERMVRVLRGIYAPHVALLGIGDKVDMLAEITLEYRSAVNSGRDSDNTASRAANERGHEYLLEAVGLITGGEKDTQSPEHAQNREALLAPLYEQIEIVRARRRRAGESGDNDTPDNDTDYDDIDDDIDDNIDDDIGAATMDRDIAAAAAVVPAATGQ